jgi:hypothetical protein
LITSEVSEAIEELKKCFPANPLAFEEDGQGGAFVALSDFDIGPKYKPSTTFFKFHLPFQYPRADVYPLYVHAGITRSDGQGFGEGIQRVDWRGEQVLQLSRRSNHLDPTIDTAAVKLAKVLQWFRSR